MGDIKVIAGLARGRSIKSFKDDLSVRPILARIKKSLFDILRNDLPDCCFLDLYAGTGAVGIEAISRGAKHTMFVDADSKCVNIIKENLKYLRFEDKASVYQANILGGLSGLKGPFDIIFMGVPYKDKNKLPLSLVAPTLEVVVKADLLKDSSLIIAQHHKKEGVASTDKFDVVREETYGDTVVSFLRMKRSDLC
jgi:16S rRNA (guanine(966)-N(2))-methyltransferase RsmD